MIIDKGGDDRLLHVIKVTILSLTDSRSLTARYQAVMEQGMSKDHTDIIQTVPCDNSSIL